ncbi:hypothetical protein CLHUN_18830 [Ruminiclostridium hungatei]|uniref:Uncharacterized protein n=1 Tax=Ruminiclostridium hungatei TaxID=48256 RepID=A0A1V4SLF7_RUMHU|nr:hypothetical protein [Ruminiclostridium hungatei]OPX44087.1 hypothetical protein CLHUN_18830 [Ruminiclostridium hungatei]
MDKKKILLLNIKMKELGSIQWSPTGEISAYMLVRKSALTMQIAAYLKEIIDEKSLCVFKAEKRVAQKGEPSKMALIEKKASIAITDELFPIALITAINKKRDWAEKIFAILEADK